MSHRSGRISISFDELRGLRETGHSALGDVGLATETPVPLRQRDRCGQLNVAERVACNGRTFLFSASDRRFSGIVGRPMWRHSHLSVCRWSARTARSAYKENPATLLTGNAHLPSNHLLPAEGMMVLNQGSTMPNRLENCCELLPPKGLRANCVFDHRKRATRLPASFVYSRCLLDIALFLG